MTSETQEAGRDLYTAVDLVVRKAPVRTQNEDGSVNVTLGFPVCQVDSIVGKEGAEAIAKALTAMDGHEGEITQGMVARLQSLNAELVQTINNAIEEMGAQGDVSSAHWLDRRTALIRIKAKDQS